MGDPSPHDLVARAKLLSEREFAALFAAATCKEEGETHEHLEKIIDDFEKIKIGIWLLEMMQQGEFTVGWSEERGEVIHRKTTPEQQQLIRKAMQDFDRIRGDRELQDD